MKRINTYSLLRKMGIAVLVPALALILMVVIIKPAYAHDIFDIGPEVFTDAAETIDFEDAPSVEIGDFYFDRGVTIVGMTGGGSAVVGVPEGGTKVACSIELDSPPFPAAVLTFSPPVFRAGFYISTFDDDDTIVMIFSSDGKERGKKTFETGGNNSDGSFLGVQFESGFDRLEMEATGEGNGFRFICIDNLMFEEPPPNHAPECSPIKIELTEDTAKTVALSCSDPDADDTIVIEIVSTVDLNNVSVGVGDDGTSVILTPDTDFNGDAGSFTFRAKDNHRATSDDAIATVTVTAAAPTGNHAPDCADVVPSQDALETPNHKMRSINLSGATDIDGDSISYIIDSIFQDEEVRGKGSGNSGPDGAGVGTDTAQVRAERDGKGDGRVYEISYTASDDNGGECNGSVFVGVPHDKGGDPAVNSGTTFDSTDG